MILKSFLLLSQLLLAADTPPYKVEAQESNLNVKTPYGNKTYIGDLGFGDLKNYRLEIPLSDLRPPKEDGGGGEGGKGHKDNTKFEGLTEDELVFHANQLYNQGKFQDALRFVDELLRRNKTHVRGWMMKGSLMHALGQKEFAKNAWGEALKLDPQNQQLKNIVEKNP